MKKWLKIFDYFYVIMALRCVNAILPYLFLIISFIQEI